MRKFKIPLSKPNLTKQDWQTIKKCFDSTWISSKSPWVDKFEEAFAKSISRTKYALAVNSGTSALFLALRALNIGPGDEVILPSLTMIATINAVSWIGAKPILVDSTSNDNWNMDPKSLERKISQKTKAIIPVDIYGYPCDMDRIFAIARKYKLPVIKDAAEAMGSIYKGRVVGSLGDVACFSLYSNKIITTANGGMVCTNNESIYNLIKKLRFFDFSETGHFKHHLIGYNLVLSGLQAALGYSQVKRFANLVGKRRKIYSWYRQNLNHFAINFVEPQKNTLPNYWFPAVICKNKSVKNKVIKKLNKNQIEYRDFFLPLHLQPVYKSYFKNEKYPCSEYFFARGLLLPSYHDLSLNQVSQICKIIIRSLNN